MSIAPTMSTLVRAFSLAAFAAIAAALWSEQPILPTALAQTDAAAPETPPGVEVLARGPVHEAYAEPAGGRAKEAPFVPKQPPDPIEELPPDQKPDGDVQWLSGYWAFDEEKSDYLWISGFWRVAPPGRQWVAGHWNQVDGGWQWVPGFWAMQQQTEVTYLPPPPEPVEVAPSVPAPTPDHTYVAGCWIYRDSRYVWRPGFWCGCRPGWVWVPAHYGWTPCGYVFVDGYWDYTLRERGLLFAPVCVDVTICRRPGWYYSPRYVIHDECLVGALFVRPGHHCYYFGDYFEPRHRQLGFVAWYDVRIGGHSHDPLFAYYSHHHRSDPGWSVSLRATYVGRYEGTIARPPRTLIQQNTIVKNVTINNTVINNNTTVNKTVNNNVNNTMLTSLNQVSQKGVNLKPVTQQDRTAFHNSAAQVTQAGEKRGQQERQLMKQGPAPLKATDAPRVMRVDLPKTPAAPVSGAVKAPPVASDNHPAKAHRAGQPAAHTPEAGNAPATQPKVNAAPLSGAVKAPPIAADNQPAKAHHAGQPAAHTPAAGNAPATNRGNPAAQPKVNAAPPGQPTAQPNTGHPAQPKPATVSQPAQTPMSKPLHPDGKGGPTTLDKKGPPPKTAPPPTHPAPDKRDDKKDKEKKKN